MAINKIFASDQRTHRVRTVPAGTKSGDPLLLNARPAFAITDRGDATRTQTAGLPAGLTSITYKSGGVGLAVDQATVSYTGTFEAPVTGATTSTGQDVAVYITATGELTLTDTGNTLFGYTDYPVDFVKAADRAAVRIGA